MKEHPKRGYLQKILRVDLSSEKTSEEWVTPELIYQYIGGTGLGIRLLWDEVKPGLDPYPPENCLIFLTGPLTGTLVPGSGTYAVITKNTLTGLSASAQANGFFGARLKYAGYDGIIIQGCANRLVVLNINDGRAEIEDGSDLKGKDTSESNLLLRRKSSRHFLEPSPGCIHPPFEFFLLYKT